MSSKIKSVLRPYLLLGDMVEDLRSVDNPKVFRPVPCRRKEAYGVPNGDAIVKGLTLLVRLGRNADIGKGKSRRPELSVSATDEALRLAGMKLDTSMGCRICTVDGDVMVLYIFTDPDFHGNQVSYYLVYDSAAASLFLLPRQPTSCRSIYTMLPLKVKAEEEDKYSLVLMAERSSVCTPAEYTDPVLALWSPSDDNNQGAWVVKKRVPSKAVWPAPFEAQVVFSCAGYAVWGDLSQGIIYCHCNDLIHGPEPVGFRRLMLPEECRTVYDKYDWDQVPIEVYRNMGCVGDSIWLVVIEPSSTVVGDAKVKVWTLDLPAQEWNVHNEFMMRSMWEQGFFQKLPKVVPMYPFVRRLDDRCIYMLLREPYNGDGVAYGHVVSVDVRTRGKEGLLRRGGRFVVPMMELPVILDALFFGPTP